MTNLMEQMKKNSTIKSSSSLTKSKIFYDKDNTVTDMPILNLALSGHLDKGFESGIFMIAGPSKHFKSNLGLVAVRAYMKKNQDAVCLFYDSEFGITPNYVKSLGIDPDRTFHSPITNIEELKFDIMKQLEGIQRGQKVIIFIDSVGNSASKKEVEDALDQKSVADMSRSRQLKSLWRMITPHLTLKDIPCVAINHTYMSQEFISKTVVSGGTGGEYSSTYIFTLSRAMDKEDGELAGYKFTIDVYKSRHVKEKSKFPFVVKYDKGINKWSGLLDIALETGHVVKPSNGYYSRPHIKDDKKWRAAETDKADFWTTIFKDTDFKEACTKRYALGQVNLLSFDDDDETITDLVDDDLE